MGSFRYQFPCASIPLVLALILPCCRGANAKCTTTADCSYNGKCGADGVCDCLPQWSGPDGERCDVLSFEPLDPRRGVGLRIVEAATGQQTSSWGGSILLGDNDAASPRNDLWHMWSAEMTHSTGIKSWRTNSRVVYATANRSSAQPWTFTRRAVAQPVFAHEPTVARAPSGEYVMMFTANLAPGHTPGSQCGPQCLCGTNGSSCLSCPNAQACPVRPASPLASGMSWSPTAHGPWSEPRYISAPTTGDTNLACIIRRNSSLFCLGRPSLGAMTAPHWNDTAAYEWRRGVTYGRGEDPMIYEDATHEGVLHVLTHGGGWGDPYGFHYWSDDGGWNWNGTGARAYGNNVTVVGERYKLLSRRERPHMVLDARGAPVALSTAVTEAWPCTTSAGVQPDRAPCHGFDPFAGKMPQPPCGVGSNGTILWCPLDYSYTLVQPLKTAKT